MDLGRLRMALPRFSFGGAGGGSGETGSLTAVYVVYTLVLFVVFLLVNFPFDVIVQQALLGANLPGFRIEAGTARFAWHRGVEVRNVRLTSTANPDSPPWFEARSVFLRPAWLKLLRGDLRSFSVETVAYNGTIDADVRAGSIAQNLAIELDSLNLARYAPLTSAIGDGEVNGFLSGSIHADTKQGEPPVVAAVVRLEEGLARGVPLVSTIKLPELSGCGGEVKLEMKTGKIDIQEGTLACDQIKLTGNGTIQVKPRAEDTVVNLHYQSEIASNAAKEWEVLHALIGCSATGTLGKLKPQPCPKAPKAAAARGPK